MLLQFWSSLLCESKFSWKKSQLPISYHWSLFKHIVFDKTYTFSHILNLICMTLLSCPLTLVLLQKLKHLHMFTNMLKTIKYENLKSFSHSLCPIAFFDPWQNTVTLELHTSDWSIVGSSLILGSDLIYFFSSWFFCHFFILRFFRIFW